MKIIVAALGGILLIAAGALLWHFKTRAPEPEVPRGPEPVSVEQIQRESLLYQGSIMSAEPSEESAPRAALFQAYGIYASTAFDRHGELITALNAYDPAFAVEDMSSSTVNSIATFNTRQVLILGGCIPERCADSLQVVGVEPAHKAVYLLRPAPGAPQGSGSYILYGSPDDAARVALMRAFMQIR